MITAHAMARMQQRAITKTDLSLLLEFGSIQHDHRGAEIYHFDRASDRRMRQAGVGAADSARKTYAVMRDGRILTVGYRRRPIRRH